MTHPYFVARERAMDLILGRSAKEQLTVTEQPRYPAVLDGEQKAIAAAQVNLMTGGQPDRTRCMVLLTDFWRSPADMCQEPRTHHVEVYSYEAGFASSGVFSPATTYSAACDQHTEEIKAAPGFIDAYPITNPAA